MFSRASPSWARVLPIKRTAHRPMAKHPPLAALIPSRRQQALIASRALLPIRHKWLFVPRLLTHIRASWHAFCGAFCSLGRASQGKEGTTLCKCSQNWSALSNNFLVPNLHAPARPANVWPFIIDKDLAVAIASIGRTSSWWKCLASRVPLGPPTKSCVFRNVSTITQMLHLRQVHLPGGLPHSGPTPWMLRRRCCAEAYAQVKSWP